ncbi:MAG: hypothetical protein OEV28_14315 [Nitrospirota bacterium]|nr:hypothetical protein [Nitrospirota bacterium]
MRIKFLTNGTSPDIGVFDAGLERTVSDDIGRTFIERGLAEEVASKLVSGPGKKEVKAHGV